jgi:hypothetical protein
MYGKKEKLARMAWKIERLTRRWKIKLRTVVVLGKSIPDVDARSRIVTQADYMLTWSAFKKIKRKWGEPYCDLMATRFSRKVQRFVSYDYDELAIATNAFSITWQPGRIYYVFPTAKIINKVIKKAMWDKAKLIIVTPLNTYMMPMIQEVAMEQISLGKKAIVKEGRSQVETKEYIATLIDGSISRT